MSTEAVSSPSAAAAAAAPAASANSEQQAQPSAAVQDKAAMDTDSHSHSYSTPAFDANSDALSLFLTSTSFTATFDSTLAKFKQYYEQWQDATANMEKFIAACSANSPAITLPRSLRWKLTQQSRLTAVEGNEAFYSDEIADLKQIEKEASEKAYTMLKKAKEKHVAYLKQKINPHAFLLASTEEFKNTIASFTRQFSSLAGSPLPAAAPAAASSAAAASSSSSSHSHIQHTINVFHKKLSGEITQFLMERTNTTIAEEKKKELDKRERREAEQTVLAGAHTGQTISMIVEKQLQPIAQSVQKLKQVRSGNVAESPAAASSSKQQRYSGRKQQRDDARESADVYADTTHPGTSVQHDGDEIQLHPAFFGNSSSHPPFKAARHSYEHQPKNGEGGGRSHEKKEVRSQRGGHRGRGRGRGGRGH